jgi:hypothetical protein
LQYGRADEFPTGYIPNTYNQGILITLPRYKKNNMDKLYDNYKDYTFFGKGMSRKH